MLSLAGYSQQNVTMFLGIPVDGSETEMVRKLKEKGFVGSGDVLEGEFNGEEVKVYIGTTNNKVSRIHVRDANPRDETQIRLRFNKLCSQFMNSDKYFPDNEDGYYISDKEDISYNMIVKNKQYEAIFYQLPAVVDTIAIREVAFSKFTEEQWANMTEEMFLSEVNNIAKECLIKNCLTRQVWFCILGNGYGKYYIGMYYDNEKNRADGSDL